MDFKDSFTSNIALDELRIANFIDSKLIRNDPENGIIQDYAFQTQHVGNIMGSDWSIYLK